MEATVITKEQIKNAQNKIKSVKSNIKRMQESYGSLSKLLRDLRLDTEQVVDSAIAFEAVGLELNTVTPALTKSILHPSQMVPTKCGKEMRDLMSLFVEKKVYDEVEATLPDGSKKKVRVPRKDKDGKYVTEIGTSPIREGKWTVDALFTLITQAQELASSK